MGVTGVTRGDGTEAGEDGKGEGGEKGKGEGGKEGGGGGGGEEISAHGRRGPTKGSTRGPRGPKNTTDQKNNREVLAEKSHVQNSKSTTVCDA